MAVFGEEYASAYDALYREKDYSSECQMIEAFLGVDDSRAKLRVLDLGCGTGNHAIPLAGRGLTVTGVDLSEPMLAQARAKAANAGVTARTAFHQGDIRSVRVAERDFDAAIMMFAVLGYQQSDADVRAAMNTVRAHVVASAPFIFDVWYGPGVLSDKPGPRERVIEKGGERVIRRTDTILDAERHLCTVKFDLEIWREGTLTGQTHEEHVMRFFFPEELESFAAASGFTLETLRSFPAWQKPITPSCWNTVGVLRAI